jgi:hypothetical protein
VRPFAVFLCALCLAWVAAGAEADVATPVEGPWSATTAAGLPVSFEVKEGQVVNARFTFRWGFCGVFESDEPMSVPIDPAGHWKYLDNRGPWIEGDFVAPDQVEGTVVAPSRELPGCPKTETNFVASPGEATPPSKPEVRAVDDVSNRQLAKRPHKIVLSGNDSFYFYRLKWQSFGGRVARATGTAYTRTGCVGCPREEVKRPRVTLRLTHLVRRGPFRIYARLHFVLHGPIPRYFPHRGSERML